MLCSGHMLWPLLGGGVAVVAIAAGSCAEETSTSTSTNTQTGGHGGATSTTGSSTGGTAMGGGGAGGGHSGGGGVAGAAGAGGVIDYCAACGTPVATGSLANGAITEASGLASSQLHPGLLYVNNDSGDSARFFGVDSTGADQGVFNASGASAVDWEDMALGPCGGPGTCVHLADVGDNAEARTSYAVYRVPEPTAVGPGAHDVAAETLSFQYPDGSHNCETLLVHPTSGEIVLVTKVATGPSGIYRFPTPLQPGTTVALVKVGELTPPSGSNLFTGGDVHPTAKGVLLRTYSHLWFFPMEAGETIEQALAKSPCSLPVAAEPQGEAVAWTASGTSYVTVSEGAASALYQASCSGG